MTARENNNTSPDPGREPSIAALLRLAADGELSGEERLRLDAHLADSPRDARRIAFEKDLRIACARAASIDDESVVCPEAVRERVLASLPSGGGSMPISRWFTSGRWYLNAAAILLVVSASIMFLRVAVFPSGSSGGAAMASFVAEEHNRCVLDADAREHKMVERDLSEVPKRFRSLLETSPSVPDIEALGFKFLGAGPCGVPGRGKSIHLVFGPKDDAEESEKQQRHHLSVFIQQDTGELDLRDDVAYEIDLPNDKRYVLVWRRAGLIHYLVAECPFECKSAGKRLAAPEDLRVVEALPRSKR